MNTQTKIICAQGVLIIGGIAVFGWQTLKSHDAQLKADVQQQESTKQQAALDAKDKAYQAQITQFIGQVKTSSDAIKVVTQYVSVKTPDNKPAVIETQKNELSANVQSQISDSKSYVVETQEQSVEISQKLLQGSLAKEKLDTCNQKLDLEAHDAQRWESVAKGGSRWQRIWKTTKDVAIGAAAGIAVGYTAHK